MSTFRIIDQLEPHHFNDLVDLFNDAWWSIGRTLEDARTCVAASTVNIGIVDADNKMVAFARALSDKIYHAVVFDVIVASSHRGNGLGKMVMDALMTHPELGPVEYVELYTKPQMTGFYKPMGFTQIEPDLVYLRTPLPDPK